MWIELTKRSFTIILICFQAAVLDWYLVYYGGSKAWLGWIAADVFVVVAFITSFVYADAYFKQNDTAGDKKMQSGKDVSDQEKGTDDVERETGRLNDATDATDATDTVVRDSATGGGEEGDDPDDIRPFERFENVDDVKRKEKKMVDDEKMRNLKVGRLRKRFRLGALPLAYLSWAFYSVNLAAKMLVIFLTFGDELDANILFGSNMLELAFVLTAGVFAMVVTSHKEVPKDQVSQRNAISYMQNQVLMDILDSVELLEYVYEEEENPEKHPKVETAVKNAILTLVAIQLIIPTIGLYQLSATNFAHVSSTSKGWSSVQQMLNVGLENIPFLVIRIYMWSRNQFTESTFIFITKNIFEIFMNDWDFVSWLKAGYRKCTREGRAKGKVISGVHVA